ncbi:MAG: hypothetical protein P1V97_31010 [Planctomycetota bacterium]|nr:hypothetical protein [Planctomycetota bacterium]
MIYEYALDPKLLLEWRSLAATRFIAQSCGLGTPRIVSSYPSKRVLRRMATDVLNDPTLGTIERTRIAELLEYLLETVVQRKSVKFFDKGLTWHANAVAEDDAAPFYAIMSSSDKTGHLRTLLPDDIGDPKKKLWCVPHGEVVNRDPAFMRQKLSSLLRCSSHIIFIDPYLRLGRSGSYSKTIRLFINEISMLPNIKFSPKIEFHSAQKTHPGALPLSQFKEECEVELPSLLPKGLTVEVKRWKARVGSDVLHNRYLLTDIGGICLGNGFSEGKSGSTDDLAVLSREQYELRWEQYVDSQAFEEACTPFTVIGTA